MIFIGTFKYITGYHYLDSISILDEPTTKGSIDQGQGH